MKSRMYVGFNLVWLSIAWMLMAQDAVAQTYPKIAEKDMDSVFEMQGATLDNSHRLHDVGFQATVHWDFEMDSREFELPKVYRRYGLIADKGNGDFRRIENTGWSIGESGVRWEQGGRLICNKSGSFIQSDPFPMADLRVSRPQMKVNAKAIQSMTINTQALYSPIGLITMPFADIESGRATPDALLEIEKDSRLIHVSESDQSLECLYLLSHHKTAFVIVYAKQYDGMVSEYRCLYRDLGDMQRLPLLKEINPAEIAKWPVVIKVRGYWSKVGKFWVPSIVDHRETPPAYTQRCVYSFIDWKVDKDIDANLFDEAKFAKTEKSGRYALTEVTHDYVSVQEEIDRKALELRKRFKVD